MAYDKAALANALTAPPPVVRSSLRFLLPHASSAAAFSCPLCHPRRAAVRISFLAAGS
jgi:hypothetical protein